MGLVALPEWARIRARSARREAMQDIPQVPKHMRHRAVCRKTPWLDVFRRRRPQLARSRTRIEAVKPQHPMPPRIAPGAELHRPGAKGTDQIGGHRTAAAESRRGVWAGDGVSRRPQRASCRTDGARARDLACARERRPDCAGANMGWRRARLCCAWVLARACWRPLLAAHGGAPAALDAKRSLSERLGFRLSAFSPPMCREHLPFCNSRGQPSFVQKRCPQCAATQVVVPVVVVDLPSSSALSQRSSPPTA